MQGAADIRAGGAFYDVTGTDKLSPTLAKIQKKVAAFSAYMQKAGKTAAIAGAGLAAPLVALFKGGTDRAADLAKLSLQLGVPIETLHKFQYAAEAAGVSLDEVMNDWQGRYSGLIGRAPAIDPKDAKAAAQAQLELSDATRSVQLALLPLVQITTLYVKRISEWVRQNSGAARTILAVGMGLIAFGVTLKITGALFAGIIPVATAAWAAMTGPVGLGVGLGLLLGGGAFIGIMHLTGNLESLKNAALDAGQVIGTTFGGISDALAKADITLAWKIAVKGMQVGWLELVEFLTSSWAAFKSVFVDGWVKAVGDVEKAFITVGDTIGGVFRKISSACLTTAITIAEAIDKLDPTSSLAGAIAWAKDARAATDAVGSDTAAKKAAVDARVATDLAKRDKERTEGVMKAMGAVADARRELGDLRAEAAKPGEGVKGAFDDKTPLKNGLLGGVSVKGSFSGAAIGQQLGISDQAAKQTELMKSINDGSGRLPEAIALKIAPVITGAFAIK